MKAKYVLPASLMFIAGCTTAFEIGESLNRATTNIANDPKVIWSIADQPASAPVASTNLEAASAPVPAEATKEQH